MLQLVFDTAAVRRKGPLESALASSPHVGGYADQATVTSLLK